MSKATAKALAQWVATEVKFSPVPSTLGKKRIRNAVLAASRAPLAGRLAAATGTDKKTAMRFLKSLGEIAYREVKNNGEFTIPGIGKLVKRQYRAGTGRNPATGAAIQIPAKTVIRFRVAKAAKDSVLGGRAK